MIENVVRSGKIDAEENVKRSTPRKKENEVNSANVYNKSYSKLVTVGQPMTATTSLQGKNLTQDQTQKNPSSHLSR